MKRNNNLEVILLSDQSTTSLNQEDFIKWLTTELQPSIDRQEVAIKKISLKIWKQTPAIYLS